MSRKASQCLRYPWLMPSPSPAKRGRHGSAIAALLRQGTPLLLQCAFTIEREIYVRMIPIGAQGSFAIVVSPEHLANQFKDATLPAVFATPVMIMAMENAALNAIKPYFEAGESAVGTRVDVSHVAATPVGRRVVAFAEVTNVAGRHIEFRVPAPTPTRGSTPPAALR